MLTLLDSCTGTHVWISGEEAQKQSKSNCYAEFSRKWLRPYRFNDSNRSIHYWSPGPIGTRSCDAARPGEVPGDQRRWQIAGEDCDQRCNRCDQGHSSRLLWNSVHWREIQATYISVLTPLIINFCLHELGKGDLSLVTEKKNYLTFSLSLSNSVLLNSVLTCHYHLFPHILHLQIWVSAATAERLRLCEAVADFGWVSEKKNLPVPLK